MLRIKRLRKIQVSNQDIFSIFCFDVAPKKSKSKLLYRTRNSLIVKFV